MLPIKELNRDLSLKNPVQNFVKIDQSIWLVSWSHAQLFFLNNNISNYWHQEFTGQVSCNFGKEPKEET